MAQRKSRRSFRPEDPQPRSDFWHGQHQSWLVSGLTQAEFCEQHELSLSAFCWWRWKLKRDDPGSGRSASPPESGGQGLRLVPVRVVDAKTQPATPLPASVPGGPSSAFEVLLESGTRIRVPGDFNVEALSRLLRTLEAVGC